MVKHALAVVVSAAFVSGTAVADSTPASTEGTSRFAQNQGTGKANIVQQANNPLLSVEQSIEQAQAMGGVPMDASTKDVNLPGLKKDDPSLRPWVLHTRNGVNEVVKLSSNFINRIATPFKKPLIVEMTKSKSKVVGSDVYYMPEGKQPVGLFIIDAENKNQSISLTVMPTANIPGQNVMVKVEDLRAVDDLAPGAGKTKSGIPAQETEYVGFLRNIMTQAVRGKIQGFSAVPLEGGVAKIGEAEVTPEFVFSGSSMDIYRYRLNNKAGRTLDLSETAFYRKGVRAVSFFPRLSLESGEAGYVFIAADKSPSGDMIND